MTNNMTYENLLDTFDSFEAYLPFVTKKFDDDLWLKTQTENTTQAYELYLSTLPNGIHKQEATANINKIKRQQEEKAEQERQEAQRQRELEEQRKKEQAIADDKAAYERAKRTNSKAAYEKYLKNFANGAYRTEAKAKVDHFRKLEQEEQTRIQRQKEAEAQRQREQAIANDHQAYESAKRTNTKSAYESYLRNYPYGLHRNDATAQINYLIKQEEAERQARQRAEEEKIKYKLERQVTQKARWMKFWAMTISLIMGGIIIVGNSATYTINKTDILTIIGVSFFFSILSSFLGATIGSALHKVFNRKCFGTTERTMLAGLILGGIAALFDDTTTWLGLIFDIIFSMVGFSLLLSWVGLLIEEISYNGFSKGMGNTFDPALSSIRFATIWSAFWLILGWIIAINIIDASNQKELLHIYTTIWITIGIGTGSLVMQKFFKQV